MLCKYHSSAKLELLNDAGISQRTQALDYD